MPEHFQHVDGPATPASMTVQPTSPAVTVIALCYNHARFLHACLDSIRAQTCQDFELIVTDDCSRDNSAELIAAWLAEHRPDARFIQHGKNAGLCATLNEAVRSATGEFISVIATDDTWEADKIERQLAAMRAQPASVAVLYSDAWQMDEDGKQLPKRFIEQHRPGFQPPSGKIFSALADGNFIPAMATLIRRQALADAGYYDERLTYEDYDMWLRLAASHDFAYEPRPVAHYRIVASSIVRTTFVRPTSAHCYTLFLIHERWLKTDVLSAAQRKRWGETLWSSAYQLYVQGDRRASACLWTAARRTRKPRATLLALASTLGIRRDGAKRLLAALGLASK